MAFGTEGLCWVLLPLCNSWIIFIHQFYIALNMTQNIDCYRGGQYPRLLFRDWRLSLRLAAIGQTVPAREDSGFTPWCLGGNGGMDYRDYYYGLHKDYYRIHSPISSQTLGSLVRVWGFGAFP